MDERNLEHCQFLQTIQDLLIMKSSSFYQTLFTFLLVFLFGVVNAQQFSASIKGKVLDRTNQPVIYANVALYTHGDSLISKVGFTNEAGDFSLEELEPGKYWIKISYIGYKSFVSDPFELAPDLQVTWPELILDTSEEELDEVVIVGQIPLLDVQKDRVVFNVAQSINSTGISTVDLLRKSPNVFIDNSGNIRMMGRSGAFVAVNGKIVSLTGSDLDSYLRTIQSDQIEAIELITDPGAQFDAVGTAGVINIRLKKGTELGANGTFNSGYSIGNKSRYNASLSGNYRNKLLNLYGSYGFNRYQDPYQENVKFEQEDEFLTLANQGNIDLKIHALKGGIDLNISPSSIVGFMASANFTSGLWDIRNRGSFGIISNNTVEGQLWAENNTIVDRSDLSFNFNYQYSGKKGTSLNLDADYAFYENLRNNTQPNEIRTPDGSSILSKTTYFTNSPTTIDIRAVKVDFESPLGKGNLKVGYKISDVGSDNIFDFFREEEGDLTLDPTRSNNFIYQETINAAYLSYAINFGEKINLVTGLRTEHTLSVGDLQNLEGIENALVNRDYLDFFPSLNLEFTPSETHNWSFNASRRINRPAYQRLNPFQFFINELIYFQGNPFLLPEYATAFTLGNTFKGTLSSSFTFSHVNNLMTDFYLPGEGNVSIYTFVNLDDQYQYTLNFSAPLALNDWWETYGSLSVFHITNQAELSGVRFDENATALSFSMQNTFTLPKSLSLELTGFYNSPTLWGVNQRLGTIWTVDVGARKSILNDRGSVSLGVSDIFKTNIWPSTSDSPLIFINERRRDDTRRLLVSFTYNFGNSELKSSRRRETSLEDEKRRRN